MKRPSLLEGLAFALGASLGASILFTVLGAVVPFEALLRLLIAVCGFAYVVYLVLRSRERVGRVVVLALWSTFAAVCWWLSLPLVLYLLAHLGFVWLVRSLYHHGSVLPALADLGLLAFGFAASLWAHSHTASVFLSVWCFFLVQAVFVLVPPAHERKRRARDVLDQDQEQFERAYRNAESALKETLTH